VAPCLLWLNSIHAHLTLFLLPSPCLAATVGPCSEVLAVQSQGKVLLVWVTVTVMVQVRRKDLTGTNSGGLLEHFEQG
jgi:hypothetical protein